MPTTLSSEGGMGHQAGERVKEGKNITARELQGKHTGGPDGVASSGASGQFLVATAQEMGRGVA